MCHTAGVANAPKLADKGQWAPRAKQGSTVLYDHAIKGCAGKAGMMPSKGGSAAVDYMVAAAK